MVDTASGRKLKDAIEVHTVELSKYDIAEETIATRSKLHQWVFLLRRSQDYEEPQLRQLLPAIEFQPAITALQTIATKTRDRQMYDQREKARRDYQWEINGARVEGKLEGTIQTLQQLLGEPVSSDAELQEKSVEELQAQANELRQRINRPS
jgi:hypothetical protein